jgi:hypothetical protein
LWGSTASGRCPATIEEPAYTCIDKRGLSGWLEVSGSHFQIKKAAYSLVSGPAFFRLPGFVVVTFKLAHYLDQQLV